MFKKILYNFKFILKVNIYNYHKKIYTVLIFIYNIIIFYINQLLL